MTVADAPNAQLLEASGVAFAYGRRPALRDVSVTLAAGEVVALLGPNGSGKSTLIKCLLGHERAAGSIQWEGRPLKQWGGREFARRVAYLPQTPSYEPEQLVSEVVRLGRFPYWAAFGLETDRDVSVVRDVCRQLALDGLLKRRMDELSGGQRQRVFLGRCLVQEPRAMLLDEPNTYLDLRHQVELSQLLRRLAREQNIGVLTASHDLNLAASFADRLLLLHEGSLAREGTPSEVLQPDILGRVYAIEMQRIDVPGSDIPVILPADFRGGATGASFHGAVE